MEFLVYVDRFEGDTAILLVAGGVGPAALSAGPSVKLAWPRKLLPSGALEGTYLRVRVDVDPAAGEAARRRAEELRSDLRSGGAGQGNRGGAR